MEQLSPSGSIASGTAAARRSPAPQRSHPKHPQHVHVRSGAMAHSRGYLQLLSAPALADHKLLQGGSEMHHYARSHLPVRHLSRSKKAFLGSGSAISRTRRRLSEPCRSPLYPNEASLEFVDVPVAYDVRGCFDFFSASELQRPQSAWARSSGRSSRLDPNGTHYNSRQPDKDGYDGHHLGPGSYTTPLAKSGSLVISPMKTMSSVSRHL